MTPLGAVALLTVAVLLWLGVTAIIVLRGGRTLKQHVEEVKRHPVVVAAEHARNDLTRLNRAAAQLGAQIDALKATVGRLRESLDAFRNVLTIAETRSIRTAYQGLIDVLH